MNRQKQVSLPFRESVDRMVDLAALAISLIPDTIRAKMIVEGANEPLRYEADEILRQRGIAVPPDVFASAGGVTVCCFGWTRNLSHMRFGRMQHHYDKLRGRCMLHALEKIVQNDENTGLVDPAAGG